MVRQVATTSNSGSLAKAEGILLLREATDLLRRYLNIRLVVVAMTPRHAKSAR